MTVFRGLPLPTTSKNTLGAKKVCVIDDGTDYGLGLAKTVRTTLGWLPRPTARSRSRRATRTSPQL